MTQARGVSSKIWRTVVMAGAMLSAQACGGSAKKPAPVTPAAPEATTDKPADPAPPVAEPAAAPIEAAEPAANPCAGPAAAPTPEADKPAPDVQASDKPAAKPAKKKKRPRGSGDKPVGRGFVLA